MNVVIVEKRGKVVMLKAGTLAPVIPHSFTSPSVLSRVITDKFVNHMPLYRQEAEWRRLGLDHREPQWPTGRS